MKTAQAAYRPRVQNGTTPSRYAKTSDRRMPVTRLRALPRQAVVARPRRRASAKKQVAPMPNGMSVMSVLLLAGATIGLMFIVALSWQRNAYGLAQQEVEMRSALDQAGDTRQQLNVEHSRALNPRATTALSEGAGLADFKLDQRTASANARPAVPSNKTTVKNAAAPASAKMAAASQPVASAGTARKNVTASAAKSAVKAAPTR